MVCDLQEVFKASNKFEVTDPAIHYANKRRSRVFGRTDKGRE